MSKSPEPMNLTEVLDTVSPLLFSDPGLTSELSAKAYLRHYRQLVSFALAQDRQTTAELTKALVVSWCNSWTIDGTPPSDNTRRSRRSSARKLFQTLRLLGLYEGDPLLDTPEVPRKFVYVRPLTDAEMRLCELRTVTPNKFSLVPAVLAISQAGASSVEVGRVRGVDFNQKKGTIYVPGSPLFIPRTVPLTPWGKKVLVRRLELLDDREQPLAKYGHNYHSAQTHTAKRLRTILDKAGLSGVEGIEVRSIRHWAGLHIFNTTGSLEKAAYVLGVSTLERAAELLNHPWRQEVVL